MGYIHGRQWNQWHLAIGCIAMNVKKPACVAKPARIPMRDYVCLKVLSYCIPLLDEKFR
jgi:hypothetical protein